MQQPPRVASAEPPRIPRPVFAKPEVAPSVDDFLPLRRGLRQLSAALRARQQAPPHPGRGPRRVGTRRSARTPDRSDAEAQLKQRVRQQRLRSSAIRTQHRVRGQIVCVCGKAVSKSALEPAQARSERAQNAGSVRVRVCGRSCRRGSRGA
eukprot:3017836-Rhodomonas_salina.3